MAAAAVAVAVAVAVAIEGEEEGWLPEGRSFNMLSPLELSEGQRGILLAAQLCAVHLMAHMRIFR